jgi:hypothetical protein
MEMLSMLFIIYGIVLCNNVRVCGLFRTVQLGNLVNGEAAKRHHKSLTIDEILRMVNIKLKLQVDLNIAIDLVCVRDATPSEINPPSWSLALSAKVLSNAKQSSDRFELFIP